MRVALLALAFSSAAAGAALAASRGDALGVAVGAATILLVSLLIWAPPRA